MATVTKRPAGNPTAKVDAIHILASDVVGIDPVTNAELRYYLSAEHASYDAARTQIFSGDFEWNGWIPPKVGTWTVHLRKVSDDSSVAQLQFEAA